MTKDDFNFDTWFNVLNSNLLDLTGVDVTDRDAFKQDYEEGKDVYDVIDEMADEYGRLDYDE